MIAGLWAQQPLTVGGRLGILTLVSKGARNQGARGAGGVWDVLL